MYITHLGNWVRSIKSNWNSVFSNVQEPCQLKRRTKTTVTDGDEGHYITVSFPPLVWHTGVHTEPLSDLRGHCPTGWPIGGWSGGDGAPLDQAQHPNIGRGRVLPVTKTRRPTPRTPQSGPIQVSWKQMFNDLIQAGVQFEKIDCQPNHILLHLLRQLEDNQKFQYHPKKPGMITTDKLPTTAWNLEDFLVPSKRKKPPQVTQATMPKPSKEKEMAVAQLFVWWGMPVPCNKGLQTGSEALCWADSFLVPKEHKKGYGAGWDRCRNINSLWGSD